MATLRFYHNTKRDQNDIPSTPNVSIAHKGTMAYISLGVSVLPEQWNKHLGQIHAYPQAQLYNGCTQRN